MRVRLVAFKDDSTMLNASKEQLRIEFNKNRGITDPSKIGQSPCVTPSALVCSDSLFNLEASCPVLVCR